MRLVKYIAEIHYSPPQTKNDEAMPTVKKKMLELHEEWKFFLPPPLLVVPEVAPLQAVPVFYNMDEEEDHTLPTNREEAVVAMMDLEALSEV